jgi:hypothetical protein
MSLLAAGACQFAPGGETAPGDGGTLADSNVPGIDAAPIPDAPPGTPDVGVIPIECTPNQTECTTGRTLRTCNSTGDGFATVECAFTCEDNGEARCTVASNLPEQDQRACDGDARLTPSGDVQLEADRLTCPGGCGGGRNEIIGQVAGDVIWYCLSEVNIPGGVTVAAEAGLDRAVLFFVDGNATIAGAISIDGGDAQIGQSAGGAAGPGGGAGGALSNGTGQLGGGECRGGGGQTRRGSANDRVGGGGAGGGHRGRAGDGGDGRSPAGPLGTPVPGGEADDRSCGTESLVPLVGGSGGGGGGDGNCGGDCGWPGGGGGGAIQISARGGVNVTGPIDASGGVGAGSLTGDNSRGGGGGGGAGGAILLEGSTVTAGASSLSVAGGTGGGAGGGLGGAGAAGGQVNGTGGADAGGQGQGGPGGGGGGGRIRLNASAPPSCLNVSSPSASCTEGDLRSSP